MIDASVAVAACLAPAGFAELESQGPIAPALMWSEARSALHELVWRREVSAQDGELARSALEHAPVERHDHERLGDEAWAVAGELGWAKTYDAEYVALARALGCRLVTLDGRLRRGADRLGLVVSPSEL